MPTSDSRSFRASVWLAAGCLLVLTTLGIATQYLPATAINAPQLFSGAIQRVPLTERPTPIDPSSTATLEPSSEADRELPGFLQPTFLDASLQALARNGADLSRPMASNHWIRTESESSARQVAGWARANGFEVSTPTVFLGHGGQEFLEVSLSRLEVPETREIQHQGRAIQSGLSHLTDARYTTWVGAINTL